VLNGAGIVIREVVGSAEIEVGDDPQCEIVEVMRDLQGPTAMLDRPHMLTEHAKTVRRMGRDQAESATILKDLGEHLGLVKLFERLSGVTEEQERSSKIEPHIDQLVDHTAILREVPKRLDRLLEASSRLRVGRARHRLRARLPAVGDGLIPDLAADRMVGHPFHLLAESPIPVEALEGADDPSVEEPPLLVEKAAVDHVVSQCMLEGVLDLGKEAGLIEKLRGLETPERRVQFVRVRFGNSLQQDEGDVLANDSARRR